LAALDRHTAFNGFDSNDETSPAVSHQRTTVLDSHEAAGITLNRGGPVGPPPQSSPIEMRIALLGTGMKWCCGMAVLLAFLAGTGTIGYTEDELLIFAVVSEVPKDKSRVAVKASVNDVATDTKLLASEAILNNLIWKKLEICHAMRVEGTKAPDGYRVLTVRIIDASMLPMSLQSFAGDCLIKKAIEVAPLVD
jgi:hypothetical protein